MTVATTFRIAPEEGADFSKIERVLREKFDVRDFRIEDLAFGIKVARVLVLSEDGETGNVEKEIRSIDGVGSVEVESQTLL